jgi:hypothetical protein
MPQIRISDSAQVLQITSEPYVQYGRRGYQPVVDVENIHSGETGFLIISAQSLSEPLHEISQDGNGALTGVTIIIKKESKDRMSPYVVTKQD